MWHSFLALKLKTGVEQAMKLLHQHNRLKVSAMYSALHLSKLYSNSLQDPTKYVHQLGRREKERAVRIYHSFIYLPSSGPDFPC